MKYLHLRKVYIHFLLQHLRKWKISLHLLVFLCSSGHTVIIVVVVVVVNDCFSQSVHSLSVPICFNPQATEQSLLIQIFELPFIQISVNSIENFSVFEFRFNWEVSVFYIVERHPQPSTITWLQMTPTLISALVCSTSRFWISRPTLWRSSSSCSRRTGWRETATSTPTSAISGEKQVYRRV